MKNLGSVRGSVRLRALMIRLKEDQETLASLMRRNESNLEMIQYVLDKMDEEQNG